MQAFQKTILVTTVSQLIYYLIPLVSFPILLASFDIASYGLWIEANTIASLFAAASAPALGNALGAIIASNPEDAEVSYSNALILFPVVGIVIVLFMYLAAPVFNVLTIREPVGVTLIQLLSPIVLIQSLNWLSVQVFRLRGQVVRSAILDILLGFARLLAAFYAYRTRDLLSFATAFILLQSVITLIQLVLAYRGIHIHRISWNLMRQILTSALRLSVVSQASWLVMYGDRLMLSVLSGSTSVAIYAASYQMTNILLALGWPYAYEALPVITQRWSANDIAGAHAAARRSIRGMFIMLFPAVIGLTLTGSHILSLLAPDAFLIGGAIIGLIAAGVCLDIVGIIFQYLFQVQKRTTELSKIYIQAAIFNVLTNLVAIPLFSYYGAGVTTLLTFLFITYRLWKVIQIPLSSLLDLRTMFYCVVASAALAVWVWVTVAPTIPGLILSIGGGVLIYGIGLMALRVISIHDILSMLRLIAQRVSGRA
jgi:O-antigen/teichoic acid export membrane protein